jgi:hypothetical protein
MKMLCTMQAVSTGGSLEETVLIALAHCNGANDAVMIHNSQQSVRKQKAKTLPSTDTDEPDFKN